MGGECFSWFVYALFGTSALGWLTQSWNQQFPILQPPSHSSCSAEVYEGKICVLALQLQQSYLQGREDDSTVYIESGRNALENATVSQLQNLAQLQPSEECSAAVVPFLCLYTFGLCDGNGTLHRPSSKQCMYIRNVTCKTEWDLAVAVVGEGALPHCHLLPDTTSLIQDSAPTGTLLCRCSWVQL